MVLSYKQTIAIDKLEDDHTNEVFFGGAAGGGKSALGCYWILKKIIQYPGTRGLIGRSKLTNLKSTTLKTFFEIANMQGFKENVHFKYFENKNLIKFKNGSEIVLKDLFFKPSDFNLDSLGSLEVSFVFIDEAPEIKKRVKEVLRSRIRYKFNKYGLITKMLLVGNPSKNWVYEDYFKPYKDKTQAKNKCFIQSLVTDNPYISKEYIKNLKELEDPKDKERLLYGNWEYLDEENNLYEFVKLSDLFTNTFVNPIGNRYITADIALHGSDLFVVGLWHGYVLQNIFIKEKAEADEVPDFIKSIAEKYGVPRSQICYDADGLGTYLRGYLRGAIPFNNNATPIGGENYQNLKTQCLYKFAIKVTNNNVYIADKTYKDEIIQEFEQVKKVDSENDSKLKVTSKLRIKEIIGRSPDYSDMIMMRMIFDLTQNKGNQSSAAI